MSAFSGSLPPPGEERSEFIEDKGVLLRHGSSLALMALVSTALNESDEFGEVDPEDDWKKWTEGRPELKLYYGALIDPSRDGADAVACILRAVLDPATPGRASGRNRIIIDYVTTRKAFRGKGLASAAVSFVEQAAAATGSNCYVLALEESCTYWMGQGFILEPSKRLTARLNVFPHVVCVLKVPSTLLTRVRRSLVGVHTGTRTCSGARRILPMTAKQETTSSSRPAGNWKKKGPTRARTMRTRARRS